MDTSNQKICSTRTNRSLHYTLNKLSQDSAIKVCRYNKGNGIAILDYSNYNSDLEKTDGDNKKFTQIQYNLKIQQHPIMTNEISTIYYAKQYFKNVKRYEELIPNGSKPGKQYGMAKIHKKNGPLRPVVSTIDTLNIS